MICHEVKWEDYTSHTIMHPDGVSMCRGYISHDVPNIFRISSISIIESERGLGYGRRMLEYVQEYAKTLKCNRITLKVDKIVWMLDWYLKEEFEIVDSDKKMFTLEKML